MTIDTSKGYIKITADEGKKITNRERSFFKDFVCLPLTIDVSNYEEVDRMVWKHFVKEDNPDVIELQNITNDLQEDVTVLQEETETLTEIQIIGTETDDIIMCAIADVTEVQDEVTDVLLCAVDDLYEQLEPLLPEVQSFETANIISSGLCRLYLIMVKRNLKDIETVPIRYRNYIKSML